MTVANSEFVTPTGANKPNGDVGIPPVAKQVVKAPPNSISPSVRNIAPPPKSQASVAPKVVVTPEEVDNVFKFDSGAVLVMLYVWYQANMISRDNMRSMLNVFKKGEVPKDLLSYLVEEGNKGR